MYDGKDFPFHISTQALKRMPFYHQYLKKLHKEGVEQIAAPSIAVELDLNEVQVRKDLAAISSKKGKPKAGFIVQDLLFNMEDLMGYHNVKDAVLIGAGSLGKSLLSYKGFDDCGMHIIAAFDTDPTIIGQEISGKHVLSTDQLDSICRRLNIHIGIITVPANQAQSICDRLVSGGIRAIWNFAPIHLSAPKDVLIQNENMAASLALLSKHLQEKM